MMWRLRNCILNDFKARFIHKIKRQIENVSLSAHAQIRIKERIEWKEFKDKRHKAKRDILNSIDWFVCYQPDSKCFRIQWKRWIYVISKDLVLITVLAYED